MDQTVHSHVAFLITGLNVSQNAIVMNNNVIISVDVEVQIFYLVLLFLFPEIFFIWMIANSHQFESYVHAIFFNDYDINTVMIWLFQKRKSHRILAFCTNQMSTNFRLKVLTFSLIGFVYL